MQATLVLAEIDTTESSSYKDVRQCRISKSEEATENVGRAITDVTNPFNADDKQTQLELPLIGPVNKEIKEDLLSVNKVRKEEKSSFIKERWLTKSKASMHH